MRPYARVSAETEILMHSLSVQVSYYSSLIQKNHEWEYAGVYADEGITGTSTLHRDEFNRLVADCEAGKIDMVLVKSIRRFARDTVDCLNTTRHLKELGIAVYFEREKINSLAEDGELMLTLLASFAQEESRSISENIKWATRKRFEKGIPNGHKAPYGYEWNGEMFRIITEQGEVVKEIYSRYLEGGSAYIIAKTLAETWCDRTEGKANRADNRQGNSIKQVIHRDDGASEELHDRRQYPQEKQGRTSYVPCRRDV